MHALKQRVSQAFLLLLFVLGALQCKSLLKLLIVILLCGSLVLLSKSNTTFVSANLGLVKMAHHFGFCSVLPKLVHFLVYALLFFCFVWHGFMLDSAWKF